MGLNGGNEPPRAGYRIPPDALHTVASRMNWQSSMRQLGHGSFPVCKRSSISRLLEEGTRSPCEITTSETTQRKPPLAILGSIWRALGFKAGIHRAHLELYEADDHPGWNISDEIDLPPRGECRYLVELVSDQTASVHFTGTHPVAIAICDDDDYDSAHDGESGVGPGSGIFSRVCAEFQIVSGSAR